VLYGVATDVCDKAAGRRLARAPAPHALFVVTDAVRGIDRDASSTCCGSGVMRRCGSSQRRKSWRKGWSQRSPAPPHDRARLRRFFSSRPHRRASRVLAALVRPMIGHRSGAMERLLQGMHAAARPPVPHVAHCSGGYQRRPRVHGAGRAQRRPPAGALASSTVLQRAIRQAVQACGKECLRLDVRRLRRRADMLRDALRALLWTPSPWSTPRRPPAYCRTSRPWPRGARIRRRLLLADAVTWSPAHPSRPIGGSSTSR